MASHKGKFYPTNVGKYEGDPGDIVYRSLWERNCFRWCDMNPDVVSWSSETVVIPYICRTDGSKHRYFVDLKVTFKSGRTFLVEIKPGKETKFPKKPRDGRGRRRYLKEAFTYMKNASKWEQAEKFAEARGWIFVIWTETTLKTMGIKT